MSDLARDQLADAQSDIEAALRMPNGAARDAALMQVGARAMQISVEVLIGETIRSLSIPNLRGDYIPIEAVPILRALKVTIDGLQPITEAVGG